MTQDERKSKLNDALKQASDKLPSDFGHAPAEHEVFLYLGTCQTCGAYWDIRQYRECPAKYGAEQTPCGGYIG